jgi:hypothetical protein
MKVASSCSADDDTVSPCFFVQVLNASGRRVATGSKIGRMALLVARVTENGFSGCRGVPKAGEEERMPVLEEGAAWPFGARGVKIDAASGFAVFLRRGEGCGGREGSGARDDDDDDGGGSMVAAYAVKIAAIELMLEDEAVKSRSHDPRLLIRAGRRVERVKWS